MATLRILRPLAPAPADSIDAGLAGLSSSVGRILTLVDDLEVELGGRGPERVSLLRQGLLGLDARIESARDALVGKDGDAALRSLGSAIAETGALTRLI
jgi:hypothetical protein